MTILALLATSLLFGGMVLYSFGFAAFLFAALPADVAGPTIRRAFPHFYLFVIVTAIIAAGLVWQADPFSAALLAFIAVSTIPTRQLLMPAINTATDTGAKTRFKWLHAASVLITLLHIGLSGWVLTRFVTLS
jgi:energy-converting hydrogenase Eha subunit E